MARQGESAKTGIGVELNRRREVLELQAGWSPSQKTQALRDYEDAGRSEARVRTDYYGRYPIELLQNAHDACADSGIIGRAWVVVTPHAFLVANEGGGFDGSRVAALIRLGSSTKTGDSSKESGHHTIGYKGIGFSAVFEITDQPQIIGREVEARFKFDRERAFNEIESALGLRPEAAPARYFPFELIDEEWADDADVVERLFRAGASTIIRCPFIAGVDAEQVAIRVEQMITPKVLLFMPHLNGLEIETFGVSKQWTLSDEGPVGVGRLSRLQSDGQIIDWVVAETEVPVAADLVLALNDELWSDVKTLAVSVALPWADGAPDSNRGASSLHLYFSTDEALGRSVLIHGDFYVTSNRRSIQSEGPGGEISRLVAESAVNLLAELVVSLAHHGMPLLECLALRAAAGPYGVIVGESIIECLQDAAFLRAMNGPDYLMPKDVVRLAPNSPMPVRDILRECVGALPQVCEPRDDDGFAAAFLNELLVDEIAPKVIAEGLAPSRSSVPYTPTMVAIAQWHDSVAKTDQTNGRLVIAALKSREIVLDTEGVWQRPTDLWLALGELPRLPSCLHRPIFKDPENEICESLLGCLGMEEANPVVALSALGEQLRSVDELSENDFQEILAFVAQIWQLDPAAVRNFATRNQGAMRVPARSSTNETPIWVPANQVYFSSLWTADSLLEQVYGFLERTEFLALSPDDLFGGSQILLGMLSALGVADAPRITERELNWPIPTSGTNWKRDARFQLAGCDDSGHLQRTWVISRVVDRLYELVEHAAADPAPLIRLLSSMEKPLGLPALVQCHHGHHKPAASPRQTIGEQQVILEQNAWLPASGDPLGREMLPACRVWYNIPESKSHLMIPVAAVSPLREGHLGLIDAGSPTVRPLIEALNDLKTAFPDIANASAAVTQTAHWLMARLDQRLQRDPSLPLGCPEIGEMLGVCGGKNVWVGNPVIGDLPGLDAIPAIESLPDGYWQGLSKFLKLQRASEVMGVVVGHGGGRDEPDVLGIDARAQLVAGLIKKGLQIGSVARRVANLEVHSVPDLMLKLSYGETTSLQSVGHFLEIVRYENEKRALAKANLWLSTGTEISHVAVSSDLEHYLDMDAAIINALLRDPEPWLKELEVSADDILEAKDALAAAARSRIEGTFAIEINPLDPMDLVPHVSRADVAGEPDIDGTSRSEPTHSAPAVPLGESDLEDMISEIDDYISDLTIVDPTNQKTRSRPAGNTSQRRMVSFAMVEPEPDDETDPELRVRKLETAARGVGAVLEYEGLHSRDAEEMPPMNPGFDIRSVGEDGSIRRIEVKSFIGSWENTAAGMTSRQFKESQSQGDSFWLYVVECAGEGETPVVNPIQNPAALIDRFAFGDDWRIVVDDAE